MKKFLIVVFAFLLLLALTACAGENAVLDNSKTYEISSDIHSLDIKINAADFKIEEGDKFSLESNLKYLSVSEKDGVLMIFDKAPNGSDYFNASLALCVPVDTVFKRVEILSGAAKLTADTLSADSLKLRLGAGDIWFGSLNASSYADIEGGAGKITVADGTLNNLSLEMGAGELELTLAMRGDCDLEFGIGNSDLTLIGSEDDYSVDIERGIGSISVDGNDVLNFSSRNGPNHIDIEGGIGNVNIKFRAE
ncbi:MAG: DUF4097 domain-containing protein [Ruminococcaceae bacterium]|nr:DUF4097 domain-containing protein [Oscillospiraceae bacterium]